MDWSLVLLAAVVVGLAYVCVLLHRIADAVEFIAEEVGEINTPPE